MLGAELEKKMQKPTFLAVVGSYESGDGFDWCYGLLLFGLVDVRLT